MPVFDNWSVSLIEYLPVLLAIAVVTAITRLAHWLIRYRQNRNHESDTLPQQFATLIAVIIAIISVILVIPVEVSVRNQLLTLLGLVFTAIIAFSSTSFASSILAGVMLRACRRLRPGNFISHGGDLGCITEIGLIQTEIQTRHRNIIYLPNTALLNDKIMVINPGAAMVPATNAPENVVFDKVGETERIGNLQDHREQLLDRVRELGACLGNLEGSQKMQAEQEIAAANAKIRGLDVILKNKEE